MPTFMKGDVRLVSLASREGRPIEIRLPITTNDPEIIQILRDIKAEEVDEPIEEVVPNLGQQPAKKTQGKEEEVK